MKKYIIANWKSQKNKTQVIHWFEQFPSDKESRDLLAPFQIIVAPPYPLIAIAQDLIEKKKLAISLAVQDLSAFGPGAFTGEVCPENLKDFSVDYAILGHSERRRFLGESSQLIADKVDESLRAGIQAILCLDQAYLDDQWQLLSREALEKVLLAYEPVAAIGSGQPESLSSLVAAKEKIRQKFPKNPFIYGGSVNAGNVGDYLEISDGVLLGSASLNIADFIDLLYSARKVAND